MNEERRKNKNKKREATQLKEVLNISQGIVLFVSVIFCDCKD